MRTVAHVVAARFAGGPLTVSDTTLPSDDTAPGIHITGPGFEVVLFPFEAVALAAALTEVVAKIATATAASEPAA